LGAGVRIDCDAALSYADVASSFLLSMGAALSPAEESTISPDTLTSHAAELKLFAGGTSPRQADVAIRQHTPFQQAAAQGT
jgi:hypothetical protein